MRHGKKVNHLSRQAPHRKAMLANMACSLIEHKRINTTVAKAKALQKYIEPLITKSKTDSTHSRRTVFSYLKSKESVTELFREVSTKIMDRPGGYTRILKTGFRLGDNAQMCFIELVDYNENMLKDSSTKKTTAKRRRGGSKKTDEKIVPVAETKVEDVAVVDEPKTEKVEDAKVEEPKAEEIEKAEDAKVEEPKAEDKTSEESNEEDKKD
ncbi:MAG: 50S ribosomal protein L17 [Flavobacteriales bacterium CG18_big_fil_WC_8_21_14_2_50_32_9]|nr:MAG: 50S ribosomal protein L17 [Flavobacteriales bacterium CG18_big_fil_WC_8_21_14_2_50_32_9]PJC62506.1 MAG: 50S ribosomal protein L17 [Flavobacteriales bacterium CG_4_9_14_0_2_um_filter_32_27]